MYEQIQKGTPTDKSYIRVYDGDGLYGPKGAVAKREISEIDFENMNFERFAHLVWTIASPASLNRFMQAALNAGYLGEKTGNDRKLHDLAYTFAYADLLNLPANMLARITEKAMQADAAAAAEAKAAGKVS